MGKKKSKEKGQFSIIAALLVAVVLISAVIVTYSTIRNLSLQEPPKVLSAIDEINLSIQRILEFAMGYYGSVLQVTGNVTYAKTLTANYLSSGFVYIANSHPAWNPSFNVTRMDFSTLWYEPTSYSMADISVSYSLSGLGIYGINYAASSLLKVNILETLNNQTRLIITSGENKTDITLGRNNFLFYNYSYSESAWKLVPPDDVSIINGTYNLQIPSGVDSSSYLIQVINPKGVTVTAFFSTSGRPQYAYTFDWNATGMESLYSSLTRDTLVVEILQNGTLRWLGQNLQLSTQGKPIPPIPVRSFRVNQTIGGVSREVPFQVEDWASNYMVPLGMSSNASVFRDRTIIVFLVNHNVQNVTLWWDGRDTANQTSYAWKNRYFTGDDTGAGRLTNGIITLDISNFRITSRVGTSTSTTEFLRINNRKPTYGAEPAYVIHHGIVRDIVQQEAEWSNGISGCPNIYSQIVLTLPANATYYTYALRTIFVDSSSCPEDRTLSDLSLLQLSLSVDKSKWGGDWGEVLTENGTLGGLPVFSVTNDTNDLFYNFSSSQTGWTHHWSEFVKNDGSNHGGGIMFTDSSNFKLYAFDSIAGQKTGALSVDERQKESWWWKWQEVTIELNPVALFPADFTYPLDLTCYGAVVTFDGTDPIYDPESAEKVGLWVLVEHPPTVQVTV